MSLPTSLPRNGAWFSPDYRYPTQITTIEYLTQDELKRFFAAIESPRDKALFGLIYHYGLRVGEALMLTVDDVNFKNHRITIRRSNRFGSIWSALSEKSGLRNKRCIPMAQNNHKPTTSDDLARTINEGFKSTASKEDMKAMEDRLTTRLDRIEHLLLAKQEVSIPISAEPRDSSRRHHESPHGRRRALARAGVAS
jgi:integrase